MVQFYQLNLPLSVPSLYGSSIGCGSISSYITFLGEWVTFLGESVTFPRESQLQSSDLQLVTFLGELVTFLGELITFLRRLSYIPHRVSYIPSESQLHSSGECVSLPEKLTEPHQRSLVANSASKIVPLEPLAYFGEPFL